MRTGYKVGDAMTKRPIMVKGESSLMKCANVMKDNHVGALIIKEKGILNILTEQDIVRRGVSIGLDPNRAVCSEVMTKIEYDITPEKDIYDALMLMRDLNIRHLPVMDKNKMMGLLTLKDILKIEPQLFDLLIEKFNISEAETQPINNIKEDEGVCNICGQFTDTLKEKESILFCEKCID